jgi:hypothetical protein
MIKKEYAVDMYKMLDITIINLEITLIVFEELLTSIQNLTIANIRFPPRVTTQNCIYDRQIPN